MRDAGDNENARFLFPLPSPLPDARLIALCRQAVAAHRRAEQSWDASPEGLPIEERARRRAIGEAHIAYGARFKDAAIMLPASTPAGFAAKAELLQCWGLADDDVESEASPARSPSPIRYERARVAEFPPSQIQLAPLSDEMLLLTVRAGRAFLVSGTLSGAAWRVGDRRVASGIATFHDATGNALVRRGLIEIEARTRRGKAHKESITRYVPTEKGRRLIGRRAEGLRAVPTLSVTAGIAEPALLP